MFLGDPFLLQGVGFVAVFVLLLQRNLSCLALSAQG